MVNYVVEKIATESWRILSLYPGGKVIPRQALYETEAEAEAVIDALLKPRDAFKPRQASPKLEKPASD
jgi:hypothetical protein